MVNTPDKTPDPDGLFEHDDRLPTVERRIDVPLGVRDRVFGRENVSPQAGPGRLPKDLGKPTAFRRPGGADLRRRINEALGPETPPT